MNDSGPDGVRRRGRRARREAKAEEPAAITQSSLLDMGRRYLERFPATRNRAAQVLARRVRRGRLPSDVTEETANQWIAQALDTLEAAGLINDPLFAQLRHASLRRRGHSQRAIRVKLRQQGVQPELVQGVMEEESEGTELEAARNYVRRRRLGADPGRQQKDLAALARAGFSFSVARQALLARTDAETSEVDDAERQL